MSKWDELLKDIETKRAWMNANPKQKQFKAEYEDAKQELKRYLLEIVERVESKAIDISPNQKIQGFLISRNDLKKAISEL